MEEDDDDYKVMTIFLGEWKILYLRKEIKKNSWSRLLFYMIVLDVRLNKTNRWDLVSN
jgi:hypothetical protein